MRLCLSLRANRSPKSKKLLANSAGNFFLLAGLLAGLLACGVSDEKMNTTSH
jgi:hypothetical protein